MRSYRIPPNLSDDLFDVSETTASLCCENFCSSVVALFGEQYFRRPTNRDIRRIENQFSENQLSKVGFPCCLGCLYCAAWAWKNCLKALQGGNDWKRLRSNSPNGSHLWFRFVALVFSIWITLLFNDPNILEVKVFFADALSGSFSTEAPTYTINGTPFN